MTDARTPGQETKKWMHWCEACGTFVAHTTGHGVDENAALLSRIDTLERAVAEAKGANEDLRNGLRIATKDVVDLEAELDESQRAVQFLERQLAEAHAALDELRHRLSGLGTYYRDITAIMGILKPATPPPSASRRDA